MSCRAGSGFRSLILERTLIVESLRVHSGPDQAQIDKGIELAKDLLAVVREKHAEARQALESGQFGSGGNQQQMYGGQPRYDQQQPQGGQPYAYQVSRRPPEVAGPFAAMRTSCFSFSVQCLTLALSRSRTSTLPASPLRSRLARRLPHLRPHRPRRPISPALQR